VATYTIVPQLPESLCNELPSPEEIVQRLSAWAGGGDRGHEKGTVFADRPGV
jgi:hypothetical protein